MLQLSLVMAIEWPQYGYLDYTYDVYFIDFYERGSWFVPFTPKSDQFQITPAASAEILLTSHSIRTWLFIAYWDER